MYFSALQFAMLTTGKKRTVQKETQSHVAIACMQKSENNIVLYTMFPADNATAGSWAGVGLVN
jgi:hypothetical protein